jgi:hypothetical protein
MYTTITSHHHQRHLLSTNNTSNYNNNQQLNNNNNQQQYRGGSLPSAFPHNNNNTTTIITTIQPPPSPMKTNNNNNNNHNNSATRKLLDSLEPLRRSLRVAGKPPTTSTTSTTTTTTSNNSHNIGGKNNNSTGGSSSQMSSITSTNSSSSDDEKDPFSLEPFSSTSIYFAFERKPSSSSLNNNFLTNNYHGNKRQACTIGKVDAGTLIDYMLATGDFRDPESRVEFTDVDLKRLDTLGKRLGKPSVLQAKTQLLAKYEDNRFTRDALNGLERMAGVGISLMYDAIERVNDGKETLEEASIRVLTVAIPEIDAAFREINKVDVEFGKMTKKQFELFLSGPPQRPTKDLFGMVPLLLEMLDDVTKVNEEEEDDDGQGEEEDDDDE